MKYTTKEIIETQEFKSLVRKRWLVATLMTVLQFIIYYGFIIIISLNKPLASQKIGEVTTLAIYLATGVIIITWIFTFIYTLWANTVYDPAVKKLNDCLQKEKPK